MNSEHLIPILICLGAFAMVFGLRYLSNKEKMAMIERGLTPAPRRMDSSGPMRWGLLMLGAGFGLLLSFMIDHFAFAGTERNIEPMYFGFILLFGGGALFMAYIIEKNNTKKSQLPE